MEERSQSEGAETLSVDDVIITDELSRRPARLPDYSAENRALTALAEELTSNPAGAIRKVAELVLQLCHADSAVISVLEDGGGEEVFRWHAAAGRFAHHLHGTMPRSASPCGTVVARNRVLLFKEAERFFPALRGIQPRIYENMLAPWELDGKVAGMVWAIKHIPEGRFDAEDARLLKSFASFAGAAYSFVERARHSSDERLAALNLMEDAVAARREVEQSYAALRDSEEKYHTLSDSIDEAYIVVEGMTDGDGAWNDFLFLEANPAFVKQTGMEYPVGRKATELLGTPNPRWAQVWGRVAETGKPLRFEEREAMLDRIFDLYVFRLGGEGSHRVAVLFTDITARKHTEEALRESEERLQKALSIENVGIIFFNDGGEFTRANEAFCRMSGYTREEMSSGSLCWHDLTPPEWIESSREALAELKAKGRTTPYEKEYFRKDGSRFWGLFAASRISEKESVEYVVDVSARKQAEEAMRASEERLRLVVESVSDYAIITMDVRGLITSWNSGAERMFGYSEEEATGRHAEIIFTPEDRERATPEEEMRAAREQGRAADERWHMSKGGVRFYVSGVLAPLRDGKGALTGYAKIARDLTERKELEDALRLAYDKLEERVRERTLELAESNVSLQEEVCERAAAEARVKQLLRQLVTVQEEERRRIARELHDTLGQQLTALRMSIDVIKVESEGRARLRQHIDRAQSIFDRLNSDVDFLAWELRPAALDLLGLDAALGNFVQEWGRQFGVEADYRGVGSDAPRLAPEVETNFYRILQEALQNVHKHAGADRVSVLLEQRAGQAILIVEDNGKGYDPDAEVSASTNKGMGVTNMRERASLLGGELEIESTPGAGTTIYVRVPLGGPESEDGQA